MMTLKHSVEIAVGPERIWDFFADLEKKYKLWHPEDHIVFKWTEGKPMELHSRIYSEQYMMGRVTKYDAYVSEVIHERKIIFKFKFPLSVTCPKLEWILEPAADKTVFTSVTYLNIGKIFRSIFKKRTKELVESHDKHVAEEGENLKGLLE